MRRSLALSWRFLTSKLHQPLPLNRRESQQLLTLLNDSFNRNLDRQYAHGLSDSDHSPDNHIKSLLKSPLFNNNRIQNPSASLREARASHHGPPLRDLMFAVEQPVEYFKQQVAAGKANLESAKLTLDNQMKICLASASSDLKHSITDSEIGSIMVNWLWSSGQYERLDFIQDRDFTARLMPFLVAEGQYKPVWEWLQRSYAIDGQALTKDVRLSWTRDLGSMLRSLLQSEVTYGQGLQSAIQMFLTNNKLMRLFPRVAHVNAQRINFSVGTYLVWEFASHGASANIEDTTINNLKQSIDNWGSNRTAPYKALIDLSHPRAPDASRALRWISTIESSGDQLAEAYRQSNVRIGLKTVEILLAQGSSKEAARVMKVLQTKFAPEVGPESQPPNPKECEEESIIRSLNLLLAT
ncbi:MAG: hypothetical protein Q9166_006544 [cf. Caloplaca sp. 2 TL-2023]